MANEPYEVVRIDERSWRIEENGVRCFVFAGDKTVLLVDTGFGAGDLRAVVQGLTGRPVMLVNTHADGDHLGCNGQFAKTHMHPAEFDRYHLRGNVPAPARPLWEGDVIDLGGRRFEVILIPGHTPGSIALLDAENRILVGGDSVQAGNHIFMFGPGRNLPAYIASLQKLAARGGFDTVYPSHGDFPLKRGILDDLTAGARRVLAGGMEYTEADMHGQPVRVYNVGVASFLYNP